MKKSLLFLILLLPSFALAENPAANPADYPVAVHVQASSVAADCSDVTNGTSICFWNQHLTVTIDGKKYELVGNAGKHQSLASRAGKNAYVLRTGDYKAKVLKEDTSRNYEYERRYEFLFADGTIGDFQVMGESE